MWQRLRKDQKGFTLIELVVVVAILGILAVIVTPKVMGAVDNAKKQSSMSSAKQVQVAMERYAADNSAYPTAATLCTTAAPLPCTVTKLNATLGGYVNAKDTDFTTATYTDQPSGSYTLVLTFTNGKVVTVKPDTVQ